MAARACPTPAAGIRLGPDSIAGFAFHTPFPELRARCAAARLDTVSPGGYSVLALRLPFAGATVWAVSGVEPDEPSAGAPDGLPDGPPEFWYAEGDSARLPDGTLIPRTVGALARWTAPVVLVAENGDDTEGSYVVPCAAPYLDLLLGYIQTPSDTGTWRLHPGLLPDTMRVIRTRIDSTAGVPSWRDRLRGLCAPTPIG